LQGRDLSIERAHRCDPRRLWPSIRASSTSRATIRSSMTLRGVNRPGFPGGSIDCEYPLILSAVQTILFGSPRFLPSRKKI
jgi:hypothetical protein